MSDQVECQSDHWTGDRINDIGQTSNPFATLNSRNNFEEEDANAASNTLVDVPEDVLEEVLAPGESPILPVVRLSPIVESTSPSPQVEMQSPKLLSSIPVGMNQPMFEPTILLRNRSRSVSDLS